MKRDMDLAREILLKLEASPQATGPGWINLQMDGHEPEEVFYHVRMLHEEGLLEAQNLSTTAGARWEPKRLTWQGHEFLEAARNEGLWTKAKKIASEKVGGLSFDVLKSLLVKLATDHALGS
jgi:hypothetical protein